MENNLEGYLVLDRSKYRDILASAKGHKIDFKTVGSIMYYKIMFPETPKPNIVFLTKQEVEKSNYVAGVYEYKQFDNLSAKCTHYQYCDKCSEDTPHYKRGGYLVCKTCYVGYKM
jgi:hypothetical protein